MRRLKVNSAFYFLLICFGFIVIATIIPDRPGPVTVEGNMHASDFLQAMYIGTVYAEDVPPTRKEENRKIADERRSLPLKRPLPPVRLRQKSYAPGGPMQLPPVRPPREELPMMDETHGGGPPSISGNTPVKDAPGKMTNGPVHVVLKDGTIQVLAENSTFKEVMDEMSREVGFRLKMPPELGSKRVSVSLYDVPLDRAIIRLFSLVQEKNYKVKYSDEGTITNVEVLELKNTTDEGKTEPSRNVTGRPGTIKRPARRYQPYRPPSVRPRTLPSRPPSRRTPSPIAEPPPLPE